MKATEQLLSHVYDTDEARQAHREELYYDCADLWVKYPSHVLVELGIFL